MGGLLIYPWLWSLYLSFHKWSLVSVDPIKFVGLENYIEIFSDSRFQLALKNTLLKMRNCNFDVQNLLPDARILAKMALNRKNLSIPKPIYPLKLELS